MCLDASLSKQTRLSLRRCRSPPSPCRALTQVSRAPSRVDKNLPCHPVSVTWEAQLPGRNCAWHLMLPLPMMDSQKIEPSGSDAEEDLGERVCSRESDMDPVDACVLVDCPYQHSVRLVGPDGENIR